MPVEGPEEPAGGVAAAEDEAARRGEEAAKRHRRRSAGGLEDQVINRPGFGGILMGVVDDVGGSEGADEVTVVGAADPGDGGAESDGDLHGERPDAAGGADDHDLLSGAELADVAQALQGRHSGERKGGCLLNGEAGWSDREPVLGYGDELGEGAVARDATLGGLFIETTQPLPLGALLTVELTAGQTKVVLDL